MTDYRKLAESAGLDAQLEDRVVPQLERLEAVFRPLATSLAFAAEPDIRFVAAEDAQ